jgi:hypothetical protein
VTALETQKQNKSQWNEMVSAFVSAGVPIHVFRNVKVQKWMKANVKAGASFPCETTLRKMLVEEGRSDILQTIDLCR